MSRVARLFSLDVARRVKQPGLTCSFFTNLTFCFLSVSSLHHNPALCFVAGVSKRLPTRLGFGPNITLRKHLACHLSRSLYHGMAADGLGPDHPGVWTRPTLVCSSALLAVGCCFFPHWRDFPLSHALTRPTLPLRSLFPFLATGGSKTNKQLWEVGADEDVF